MFFGKYTFTLCCKSNMAKQLCFAAYDYSKWQPGRLVRKPLPTKVSSPSKRTLRSAQDIWRRQRRRWWGGEGSVSSSFSLGKMQRIWALAPFLSCSLLLSTHLSSNSLISSLSINWCLSFRRICDSILGRKSELRPKWHSDCDTYGCFGHFNKFSIFKEYNLENVNGSRLYCHP